MPTIKEFHMISPLTRVAMLEQLGESIYGTPRFRTRLANDLDISPSTIQSWVRERKVPVWILLLLWEWSPHNNKETAVLKKWEGIVRNLGDLTCQLEALAAMSRDASAEAFFDETSGATE